MRLLPLSFHHTVKQVSSTSFQKHSIDNIRNNMFQSEEEQLVCAMMPKEKRTEMSPADPKSELDVFIKCFFVQNVFPLLDFFINKHMYCHLLSLLLPLYKKLFVIKLHDVFQMFVSV